MNHNTNRSLPELLAPVGGWKQLEAAVNHGADAVYMGGSLFHARINAENFTEDTLPKAIDYAHESGVKVYMTFNTLIKDSELERAFRYACRLYEVGADALILQDMGLARLIHRYLPDFPIHLSTQGTVYNVHALDLVKQLGFRRIVPARELSLKEIGQMAAGCHGRGMDIEVFVHGALCMCYSGQCQMSRAFGGGGRSGNRGLCAQPCRLLYTDDRGRKGYFLSPKDLCTLELMPQLITAGADSFKIEGRLKSPEYVAVTTAVYRKYLDLYAQNAATRDDISSEEWKTLIDSEDMRKLAQVFNRGGFTTGYLKGNPGQKILSGSSPKNQGIYIGTVAAVRPVKGRDKVLADVQVQGNAAMMQGDGVEIRRAAEVTGNSVVTYVETFAKGILRIGDFDRGVKAGDKVYKVTDKKLREEALSAPARKRPVRMRFEAHAWQAPELTISLIDASEAGRAEVVKVTGAFAVEEALKKATDAEKVRSQLMKLGDTCFSAEEAAVEVVIDRGIMIPVSGINQMRRQAAEELAQALREKVRRERCPLTTGEIERVIAEEQLGSEAEIRRIETIETDVDLPYILNVSKGELDEYIEEHFEDIADQVRDSGILIGNLGWIKQFLDAGVTVYGDYGLNVYNSQAVRAYEELGVEMLNLSHERNTDGWTNDRRFGGRVPLMITEHPFETDYLIDRKGVRHEIIKLRDKSVVL